MCLLENFHFTDVLAELTLIPASKRSKRFCSVIVIPLLQTILYYLQAIPASLLHNVTNKSTQRAQISDKAAHYLYIAQILNLASQHGDPGHTQFYSIVPYIMAELF